jgi:hypothetical protein
MRFIDHGTRKAKPNLPKKVQRIIMTVVLRVNHDLRGKGGCMNAEVDSIVPRNLQTSHVKADGDGSNRRAYISRYAMVDDR